MNKELVVIIDPKGQASEAIKMIRTNIEHCKSNKNSKTLLITSSLPGEGKSFISSNLGVAYAQLNKKVILIDCDLRKGRLHTIFNIDNLKGLSDILKSNEVGKVEDFIVKTETKNLSIIPRGKVPFNPSELLTYKTIDVMLEVLKKEYDVIILDGTPLNGLSDSVILSKKVDMTALVTSIGVSTTETLSVAKKSLSSVDANVIGVIANRVVKDKSSYYKYE